MTPQSRGYDVVSGRVRSHAELVAEAEAASDEREEELELERLAADLAAAPPVDVAADLAQGDPDDVAERFRGLLADASSLRGTIRELIDQQERRDRVHARELEGASREVTRLTGWLRYIHEHARGRGASLADSALHSTTGEVPASAPRRESPTTPQKRKP